jgi:hypothetical protein
LGALFPLITELDVLLWDRQMKFSFQPSFIVELLIPSKVAALSSSSFFLPALTHLTHTTTLDTSHLSMRYFSTLLLAASASLAVAVRFEADLGTHAQAVKRDRERFLSQRLAHTADFFYPYSPSQARSQHPRLVSYLFDFAPSEPRLTRLPAFQHHQLSSNQWSLRSDLHGSDLPRRAQE